MDRIYYNTVLQQGVVFYADIAKIKLTRIREWISTPRDLKYVLPEASFGLRVLSLPASVRPSVSPSVTKFVRCITVQARITKFGP